MIKAFSFSIKKDQHYTIEGMVKLFSDETVEIIDLSGFEPVINKDDVILIFGSKAILKLSNVQCLAKLEFPILSQLDRKTGNEKIRLEAAKKLKDFKEIYSSGSLQVQDNVLENTLINKDVFPVDYPTSNSLLALENNLKKRGKSCWVGTTQNGKSITISIEPIKASTDISITFSELYAIKSLIDVFDVQEIEIIYDSKDTV